MVCGMRVNQIGKAAVCFKRSAAGQRSGLEEKVAALRESSAPISSYPVKTMDHKNTCHVANAFPLSKRKCSDGCNDAGTLNMA